MMETAPTLRWKKLRRYVFLPAVLLACSGPPGVRQPSRVDVAEPQTAAVDSSLEARKHYQFARQYEKSKMYDDALSQYRKALRLEPRDPKIRYSLGRLYYNLGRKKLAKEQFLRTTRLDSLHADAHYALGKIYYEDLGVEANYDSCVTEFEKAAALKPNDVSMRRILVELYAYKKRFAEALRHSIAVTELAAEDVEAWEQQGQLAVRAKQLDQGIVAYERAWELSGNMATLQTLASLQLEAGRYEEALASYRALSESDPDDYDFLARIAEAQEKLDHAAEALETLERMAVLRPDDLGLISRLAEWHFNRGELEVAKKWIDRGLGLDAESGRMRVLNGDYYAKSGQESLALAEYEKALSDSVWKANAQQRIWTLRPPLTEEEKRRRAFFKRGKEKEENSQPGP